MIGIVKESCICARAMSHIWMSQVPHMKESCFTYEGVMSHRWSELQFAYMQERCLTHEGVIFSTHEGVMSHIWRSHVSHVLQSCLRHEGVMSHRCSDLQFAHAQEPCLTYEGIMSHIWRSHVSSLYIHLYMYIYIYTHMKESCLTYWHQHTLMSIRLAITSCFIAAIACHVSHTKESCLTYEGVMSHIWMSHVSHMNKSRLTYAITSCFIAAIALMSAIASFYMFCNHIHHTHTSSECVCHKCQVLPSCRVRHPLSPKKILVRCWPISLKNYTHR